MINSDQLDKSFASSSERYMEVNTLLRGAKTLLGYILSASDTASHSIVVKLE